MKVFLSLCVKLIVHCSQLCNFHNIGMMDSHIIHVFSNHETAPSQLILKPCMTDDYIVRLTIDCSMLGEMLTRNAETIATV